MLNMARPYDSEIAKLKYPRDKARIGKLSIDYFQAWYCSQEPREMVYLGQFEEFKSFVFWHYTWKVKLLRLYYSFKNKLKSFVHAPKNV